MIRLHLCTISDKSNSTTTPRKFDHRGFSDEPLQVPTYLYQWRHPREIEPCALISMSGIPSGNAGPSSAPRSTTNGAVNGGMTMSAQPRSGEVGLGSSGAGGGQGQNMSQQNLNQIVSLRNLMIRLLAMKISWLAYYTRLHVLFPSSYTRFRSLHTIVAVLFI